MCEGWHFTPMWKADEKMKIRKYNTVNPILVSKS
jgi:hypothetical protein